MNQEKMIKHCLLVILLISLLGCQNPVEKSQFELKKDFFNLRVDSVTSNISDGLQSFSTAKKSYLFSASWSTNSINMYDLDSESLVKKIVFPENGVNGIGNLFGFYVQNLDSIYLFPQLFPKIFITDTSGVIYRTIDYIPPDLFSVAFVHNGYFLSPPIVDGDLLHVKAHIQGNYLHVSNEELNSLPLFYSIDVNSGEVQVANSQYPRDYLKEGFRFFEYSMANSNGRLVFSFFGSHKLFYLEGVHDFGLNSVDVKSEFLNKELNKLSVSGEPAPEEIYKYLFASERYESIIYDRFRNVFYRVVVHSAEFDDVSQLSALKLATDRISIQVLDNDLELLGEFILDPKRYINGLIFVSREGLCISTNHPDNLENDEDFMRFDLLRFDMR